MPPHSAGSEEERKAAFDEQLQGSPLRRTGRAGLARNAALVLGSRPTEEGREALLQSLEVDPSPLVREASAWALGTGHGEDRGVRARLEAARQREADPALRAALERRLEGS